MYICKTILRKLFEINTRYLRSIVSSLYVKLWNELIRLSIFLTFSRLAHFHPSHSFHHSTMSAVTHSSLPNHTYPPPLFGRYKIQNSHKIADEGKMKSFFCYFNREFFVMSQIGAVEVVSFTELRLIKSLKVSTLKIIFMPPFFSHSHFMTTFVSGWLSSGNVTKSQCRLLLGAFFSFLSGIRRYTRELPHSRDMLRWLDWHITLITCRTRNLIN